VDDSADDNEDDDIGDDDEEVDDDTAIDGEDDLNAEITSRKEQIEFLKTSDPDFYAYLQKHDKVRATTINQLQLAPY
jgi:nucleolar complex protein 2